MVQIRVLGFGGLDWGAGRPNVTARMDAGRFGLWDVPLGIVGAIAVYGFKTALGGRPVLGGATILD